MSKSNRTARKELEKIYGKKDMFVEARIEERIDELNKSRKNKIRTYKEFKKKCKYTKSKEKSFESKLSYHHLKHKSNNGDTSIENGAIISSLPHSYIHSLPRDEEEIINDMLREYKQNFRLMKIEITEQGIETEKIELPDLEEYETIPLYEMTEKELEYYQEYKRKRNERIIKKMEER